MVLKNTPFTYTNKYFFSSVCSDGKVFSNARERIIFHTFVNAHMCVDMYEDPDNAPDEIRTHSGDLKSAISNVQDPLEYEMILLTFVRFHEKALQAFKLWRMSKDTSEEFSSKKLKVMLLLDMIKMADKKEKEDDGKNYFDVPVNHVGITEMIQRIDYCIESKYNYEKYLELLRKETDTSFADNIINNLF